MLKTCLAILILTQFSPVVFSQGLDRYEKKEYTIGKDTLRYRILYPENYHSGRPYPVIVFLHGSGERGRDNEHQLLHGGDLFVKPEIMQHFRAIVIFPQCPSDSAWSRFRRPDSTSNRIFLSEEAAPVPQILVKSLLDSLQDHRVIDRKRIYLGGLSLGGFGTYDMLIRYPSYFAAAFSICGAGDVPLIVKNAKEVPLWIFHGALDNVVPPTLDRELYKALITSGAKDVSYTEYPTATHNSWDAAFAEPRLLPWLFSIKNKKKKNLQVNGLR